MVNIEEVIRERALIEKRIIRRRIAGSLGKFLLILLGVAVLSAIIGSSGYAFFSLFWTDK